MVALVLAGCNSRSPSSTTSANPSSSATTTATSGTTTPTSTTTSSSQSTTQTVVPVTGVWVNSDLNLTLKPSETSQIDAAVNPEDATDKGLVYSSGDDTVASVSDTGLITANAVGSTKIKVAAHGDETKFKEINVDVSDFVVPSKTSDGFDLLEDSSDILDGDYIYFMGVNVEKMYAMGVSSGGNNIPAAESTVSGDVVTPASTASKYTLEEGEGGYYIKDVNSKYLYVVSGSNHLKASDTKTALSLFKVECSDQGTDFYIDVSETEQRHIRFNINTSGSGPMFSAYKADSPVNTVPNVYLKHDTKALTSIAISGTPKTNYIKGSVFEKPTVMATYNEGEPEDVTDQTSFTGYDLSTAGNYTVTASYTYKEVTKTTTYDITVVDDILETITVGGDMTNKTYNVGDDWDPTGLTFTGHYTSAGDVDISSLVELSYDPATVTDTSVTSVEVTASVGSVNGSKTVTGITVTSKSSMQVAYEAAEELAVGKTSTQEYTYSGVVTGIRGATSPTSAEKDIFIQDGEYGMYVYKVPQTVIESATDLAVGKEISVTSKLTNYNGCLEGSSCSAITVNEDGTLPKAVKITSLEDLNALKQNVLVDCEYALPSNAGAWSASAAPRPTGKVGDDTISCTFAKGAYTADNGAVYNASKGSNMNISGAYSTAYSTSGESTSNQLMISANTVLSQPVATSITCVPSSSEVQISKTITLSAKFNGSHSADATFAITDGEGTYATIDGNTITGVAEGTIKVKAYCTDPVLESEEVTVSVVPASTLTLTRVTKTSDIISGDEYIIGYEADHSKKGTIIPMRAECNATTSKVGYIFSGTTSGSSSGTTISTDDLSSADDYKITIVASTSVSGDYCFKIGSNFIGNENTKNNCKLYTTESVNTAFKLTFETNDVVTAKISANKDYTTLQYNTGNPRFAVYGGTQQGFVLYHVA